MSSEQCSLGSILPPNYRHRAEAFARDLQQRLWSLGSKSSAPEDTCRKRSQAPYDKSCPSMYSVYDQESPPRDYSLDSQHVPCSLSQKLVNRSDGLPIPCRDAPDSMRCSFSSDSQQSIYSTPSDTFNLPAFLQFSQTHCPSAESSSNHQDQDQESLEDKTIDLCDIFSDVYSNTPFYQVKNKLNAKQDEDVFKDNINSFAFINCIDSPPEPTSPELNAASDCFDLSSVKKKLVDILTQPKNGSSSEFKHSNGVGLVPEIISTESINVENESDKTRNCDSLSEGFYSCSENCPLRLETCKNENENENESRSDAKLSCVDREAREVKERCDESEGILVILQRDGVEIEGECKDVFAYANEETEENEKTESLPENKSWSSDKDRVKLRRSSSLKTWKTPPDTPGRKKIVRFADVLGLDLADVRTFLDEIPQVPKSAFSDLTDADSDVKSSKSSQDSVSMSLQKCLVPLFQQPGGKSDFFDKLKALGVCLENAIVTDKSLLAVSGTIRVRNLDYDKSVFVRYSIDGWKTCADLKCLYVINSCDGFSDQFSFVLYAHTLDIGKRLEFAIMFQSKGCQYWDNNGGINYIFQCVPAPPTANSSVAVGSPSITDKYGGFY